MNSSTLRRLASDHSSLRTSELPPNYLFPPSDASSSVPDDLTQLTVLLAGPHGTPYSEGLWKLHLKIPEDYPKNPPKAAFRTRIWHPNVDENTGSVCVDTLKRDWESKLTLRHVLITISCLLIQPNPDSALNSTAGHLLQEDYESFARQAKLMTSIHARIPINLSEVVLAAKRRGETVETAVQNTLKRRFPNDIGLHGSFGAGNMIEKENHLTLSSNGSCRIQQQQLIPQSASHDDTSDSEIEDEASASKENDPTQSPSPVALQSPRKSTSAKRPLSDLPTPTESQYDEDNPLGISSSERNIANNLVYNPSHFVLNAETSRKTFKLAERNRSLNFKNCSFDDASKDESTTTLLDFKDGNTNVAPAAKRFCSGEGKENHTDGLGIERSAASTAMNFSLNFDAGTVKQAYISSRKPSSALSTEGKGSGRPRVGLRRL